VRSDPIRGANQIVERPGLRKELVDAPRGELAAVVHSARAHERQAWPLRPQMLDETADVAVWHLEVEDRDVENRFDREHCDGFFVRTGSDADCAGAPQQACHGEAHQALVIDVQHPLAGDSGSVPDPPRHGGVDAQLEKLPHGLTSTRSRDRDRT
jgi:hypothetical protein